MSDTAPAKPSAELDDDARFGSVVFGQPLTRRSHLMRATGRLFGRTFLAPYFRIAVHNADRLPVAGGVIVAPTHRSNLDTPLIGMALDRWLRFMAKDSMFKSPFWTRFLTGLGGFPVKRGKLDRRALQNALDILGRGEALVVFPEGARQSGPRIKPIFEGAVWIAARAGVPILPVGIGGSEAAQPIGVKIPRPKPVHFVLGELMYPPQPHEGKTRVTRDQLEEFSAELREVLQGLFDAAQVSAGSPNGPYDVNDDGDERRQPWE